MSRQEFQLLSYYQKISCLQHQGTFITVLKEHDYILKLYAIGNFFVELQYDVVRKSVEINLLNSTGKLAYYLVDLEIPK